MRIEGQKALITGATGGIGHAIARTLAEKGAKLLLAGRRVDVLESLAAEVGGQAVVSDLADASKVDELARLAEDVDIFVANAALPAAGKLEEFTVEEIDRALDINLRAPIVLAKALSERMAQRKKGQLVFISSVSGKMPNAAYSMYSATKYGLRGFSLCLREDLEPYGVGVSVICPGPIREAGMFAEVGGESPIGSNSPEEVAKAVSRAIEKNKAEIDVVPPAIRVTMVAARVAPGAVGFASRKIGLRERAADLADRQKHKR